MSAFLYRWTEKSTGKWYVGSRTAEGCHPADGYVCSSKIVKPLICSNPTNWTREILCIGSAKYIRKLEKTYLEFVNAKRNPMSYNRSNAEFSMTTATYGMKGRKHSDQTRKVMSEKAQMYCADPKVKQRKSDNMKGSNNPRYGKPGTWVGRKHSDETKEYIRQLASQRKYGPRPKLICPHCNKQAAINTYTRYHGDKCKELTL